jgi:predicted AAA+ superfamily ATPase
MDKKRKEEFLNYIHRAIAQTNFRLHGYVVDREGNFYPKRSAFVIFKKYIEDYLKGDTEPRWIVMPGLRGVGKTTLLSQLFIDVLTSSNIYKFYLSVDEIVRRFNASLWDVIEAYEIILGKRLEQIEKKMFLFFDEIQYDPKWDSALKTFYDRTKNVFILCTGSSATLLRKQISSDSARRAYFEELYPMSFTEYVNLKFKKDPVKDLGEKIKKIILDGDNSEEIFRNLKMIENEVKEYWFGLDILGINQFLKFGSMPFSLVIKEEAVILNQLEQIFQKIVYNDISQITDFDNETLNKIYGLIYMLSDSFEVSLTNLSRVLGVSKDTLSVILKTLENAGFLYRIAPYGSHYKQVRKPYKYLFATPAFRYLLLTERESISSFENFKGKLLEDVVGLYLRRITRGLSDFSLTYDSSQSGADFILKIKEKKIVIEVGYGEKGLKQVVFTLNRVKGTYGLVISENDTLKVEKNVIFLPINYFLLI